VLDAEVVERMSGVGQAGTAWLPSFVDTSAIAVLGRLPGSGRNLVGRAIQHVAAFDAR
jgi:hypothetical protein